MPTILQRSPAADLTFWICYSVVSQLVFVPTPLEPVSLIVMLIFRTGEAVAVYSHLRYGLLPLSERERSFGVYLATLAGAFLTGILVAWGCLRLLGVFVPELGESVHPVNFLSTWGPPLGWSTGTVLFLTGGIFLLARRRNQARRERELREAKTQAELAYLRGQLNPHFLFNALNNIYVLISHDPTRAQESLAGFSDLLRYQLYRSEADKVALGEEVEQVRKFAELSRLRMEEDFQFSFRVPDSVLRQVPPMLLLPLVENAFKFCPPQGGWVRAELKTLPEATEFTVSNNVEVERPAGATSDSGGIGLTNIRRRLDLLYPGLYSLTAEPYPAGEFRVHLKIPTLDSQNPHRR